MPQHVQANYQDRCRTLLHQTEEAKTEGRRIIYLDEINFTKRSVLLREWSSKNTNLTIDNEDIYVGYRSVIASMTEEAGITHIQKQGSAVTSADFIYYLKRLRQKMGSAPLALFCD